MKNLIEISRIISKNTIKKIDILFKNDLRSHLEDIYVKTFFDMVNGNIKNDKNNTTLLPAKGSKKNQALFKHRLQKKIENCLFFIDLNNKDYSENKRAELACGRLEYQVRTLALLEGINPAVEKAEALKRKAEKYQFAEFAAYANKVLYIYASYIGDRRFSKYLAAYKKWSVTDRIEETAREYLSIVNNVYAKTIAQKPEMASITLGYANEIATGIEINDTFKLKKHWYMLSGLGHEIARQYSKSLKVWKEYEKYLASPGISLFVRKRHFGEAALYQMVNYMHLDQYENGEKCAEKCDRFLIESTNNWHVFLIFHFLLCMQSGNYKKAREIYFKAINDERFPEIIETNRAKWKIFRIYLDYVSVSERTGLRDSDQGNELQSIGQLMIEPNIYKRDKTGYNIALLIIEICIIIRNSNRDNTLIDKLDALNAYKTKHLGRTNDPRYRVKVFMELLFELDKAGNNAKALKNKTNVLLKKFETTPIQYTDNIEGVEVIHFDKLWAMVLKDLPKLEGQDLRRPNAENAITKIIEINTI